MSPAAPLFDAARQVRTPTLFLPGLPSADPVELPGWPALLARLRDLAAGTELTFVPGRAAYPDFEPFWSITARRGDEYLCTLADHWRDAADRDAALRILRAGQPKATA